MRKNLCTAECNQCSNGEQGGGGGGSMREGGEGSRGGGSGSSWGKKCSGFNLGNKEQMDGTLVQLKLLNQSAQCNLACIPNLFSPRYYKSIQRI